MQHRANAELESDTSKHHPIKKRGVKESLSPHSTLNTMAWMRTLATPKKGYSEIIFTGSQRAIKYASKTGGGDRKKMPLF